MSTAAALEHEPVLLAEAVQALALSPGAWAVDGTFGRGGHSAAILQCLGEDGRLFAFDKDAAAVEAAQRRFGGEPRFQMVHASFERLPQLLPQLLDGRLADALLLDLGLSSPQLDEAQRGFGFSKDGPLDMRMDQSGGQTAAQWLAVAEHGEIAQVLREFGEERFAGRIASAIVKAREEGAIETTAQLASLVEQAVPAKAHQPGKHPATRSFQAIRIFINGELTALERVLECLPELLAPGGRAVFISFHSLEDRRVKRALRAWSSVPPSLRGLPLLDDQLPKPPMRLIGKAVKPSEQECRRNRRARSAVMRVVERCA